MRMLFYLCAFILAFIVTVLVVGCSLSAPTHTGPVTGHFDGKRFINPGNAEQQGMRGVLKWMFTRNKGEWKADFDIPFGDKPPERVHQGIRITFVNHSTFLIQVNGLNILTDPIWSERASPFSWVGPQRMRPPGISFDSLPPIDCVIISHNHYDHLDENTLIALERSHKPKVFSPLGVKAFLDETGLASTTDLDWWEEQSLADGVRLQCVPAQHFSGRGLRDRDGTLWCGYVIKTSAGNIYFGGDTGYNDETFKEIGRRSGPVKLALIPIGAYLPEWFMAPVHCSPEDAVRIHLDLQADQSIGIHHGTFQMADDGKDDPFNDLQRAKAKLGVDEDAFIVLREGVGAMF